MKSAMEDPGFAKWIEEVNHYTERFLGMSIFDFTGSVGEVLDYYEDCYRPLAFVRWVLVPILSCDYGCDFVEELIAGMVLYGHDEKV